MSKVRVELVADVSKFCGQTFTGMLVSPNYKSIMDAAISKLKLPEGGAINLHLILRDKESKLLTPDMDLSAELRDGMTICVTSEKLQLPAEGFSVRTTLLHSISSGGGSPDAPAALQTVFVPQTFISGGQVGADSIPFSVHERLRVNMEGYMPKGFERSGGGGAEIAAKYGLKEGQGGHAWRDRENVKLADALLAFLTTKPETGRGTMQTCAFALSGKYEHVQLHKPEDSDHIVLNPTFPDGKPVLVFWDISDSKLDDYSATLRQFLQQYRPRALMLSGPMERTLPGIERIGAQILCRALMAPNCTRWHKGNGRSEAATIEPGNQACVANLPTPAPSAHSTTLERISLAPTKAPASCRRVLLVGIAGASGSGKSTLAKSLAQSLRSPLLSITADQYNSPARVDPVWGKDWETPAGMDFKRLRADILDIVDILSTAEHLPRELCVGKRRNNILRDYSQLPAFGEAVFVIVEGFLLFHDEELARMCDVQLWIEAKCETCLQRRYSRKQGQRSLQEFAQFYRGLVWTSYLENRVAQLAHASNALQLCGEDDAGVTLAIVIAHCRAASRCQQAEVATSVPAACDGDCTDLDAVLPSALEDEVPVRKCRWNRR